LTLCTPLRCHVLLEWPLKRNRNENRKKIQFQFSFFPGKKTKRDVSKEKTRKRENANVEVILDCSSQQNPERSKSLKFGAEDLSHGTIELENKFE